MFSQKCAAPLPEATLGALYTYTLQWSKNDLQPLEESQYKNLYMHSRTRTLCAR